MKKNAFIIVAVAVGFIFILGWLTAIILAVGYLRGLTTKEAEPAIVDATLCDVSSKDLCIVNFGADDLNRMVINFQLPKADYPSFYVKAANRDTVNIYTCELTKFVSTTVYCTGVRTPLGETIDLEVYTTNGDKLIARGTFLVSAIALSTPISLPSSTPAEEGTSEAVSTPEADFFSNQGEVTPTKTLELFPDKKTSTPTPKTKTRTPTPTPTKTPGTAYPYP
jgi:hypothetical protein